MPAVALPSILGAMVAFGLVIGPAYALAMEKEDGTLLRVRSAPYGLNGYVSGQVLAHSLGLIPSFALLLIPSALLFGPVMHQGAEGWVTVVWVVVLGLLATMPIGIMIGSLAPNVQKVGTWGMLPILVLLGISGIFYPVQELWGWVQVVAQLFPMYWLGLGMRSAFLPEAAAALEIGGSWRTLETVLVLGAWAVVGLALAPGVLRRMARRQSGAAGRGRPATRPSSGSGDPLGGFRLVQDVPYGGERWLEVHRGLGCRKRSSGSDLRVNGLASRPKSKEEMRDGRRDAGTAPDPRSGAPEAGSPRGHVEHGRPPGRLRRDRDQG